MLWPLIEMLVGFFSALFVFAAAVEWLTRDDSSRPDTRPGRPGLGRAWWAQKQREQRDRAGRWR